MIYSVGQEVNMNPIAVDVVLLPDAQVKTWALALNRKLVEECGSEIHLDPEHCLPHVSLAMGCMASEDLESMRAALARIVTEQTIVSFPIAGFVTRSFGPDQTVAHLELRRGTQLRSLHEAAMEACVPWFVHDVTPSALHGPDAISRPTLDWIRDYRQTSSFQHFWPHMTLGFGETRVEAVPETMKPASLAVCHLGNHCTCRKILVEVPFS